MPANIYDIFLILAFYAIILINLLTCLRDFYVQLLEKFESVNRG